VFIAIKWGIFEETTPLTCLTTYFLSQEQPAKVSQSDVTDQEKRGTLDEGNIVRH